MLRISKPRSRLSATVREGNADGRADGNGPPDVAANLRRLRQQQGHSLETLAKLSGVSRAMLGQIETGKSAPTVTLLWKVAQALHAPIASLISSTKASRATVLRGQKLGTTMLSDGQLQTKSYSPPGAGSNFEVSELHLAAGHREQFSGLSGTLQATLIVKTGSIIIEVADGQPETLNEGDAILFEPHYEHFYFNAGDAPAVAYLIIAPVRTR